MRLEHVGAARKSTLTALLGPTTLDLTIVCTDLTNWPTGAIGPFWVTLSRGELIEEKILCSGRSGNTLQVWTDGSSTGRGGDGTVIQTHPVNATIEHIWTAVEADAANSHIEQTGTAHGVTFTDLATDAEVAAAVLVETNARIAADALKASLAGATFTGEVDVVSPTATGSNGVRQITISTSDPSGGADGDVWMKYTP